MTILVGDECFPGIQGCSLVFHEEDRVSVCDIEAKLLTATSADARLAAFFEGYHDISASTLSRHPNSNNHALPPRVPHRHLALLRFIYASAERQIHLTSWDVAIRIQVRGIGTHNNILNIALRSFGRQLHIASVRIGA